MPRVLRVLVVRRVLKVLLLPGAALAQDTPKGYVEGIVDMARTVESDTAYAGLAAWRLSDRLEPGQRGGRDLGTRRGTPAARLPCRAGAGIGFQVWKRIRVEGGYRYMRLFGDAKTIIHRAHVAAGWTF